MTDKAITGARAHALSRPEDLAALTGSFVPSAEQWAAITAPLRPTVVVAGAGSGKTALMAMRVVYLVATEQVRPEQILGLTFTTKAAAELRQRISTALSSAGLLELQPETEGGSATAPAEQDPEEILEPTVATYHSYAAGLLTDHGLRIGHEPDTRVITDAARYQLGARVIQRYTGAIEVLSDHPETVIQNLTALDSAMSEHLTTSDLVRATDAAARLGFVRALEEESAGRNRKTYLDKLQRAINVMDRRAELLDLVAGYRKLKSELGVMDFSDQIELAARLASDFPDVGQIERDRFRVVLLDEYQDTSVAQAIMLSRLFSGASTENGLGHPVMAVGDPNQAIYGWRGASVSNILNFADTFPAAPEQAGMGADILPLTVNRRSDRRILAVANRLAQPLLDKYGDRVARLRPRADASEGEVAADVFERADEELAWLAEQVQSAHERQTPWSEIGVLTRDNAHAAEVYETLTAQGIPVEIVGLSGLILLPEVAEIVATLTLLHDVTANTALLTLLTGPRWAIGPRDLKLLARRAAEIGGATGRKESATVAEQLLRIADGVDAAELPALSDALADPGEHRYSASARERFALLDAELRMLRAQVGDPLLDVVRRIIDTTGLDVELASATSPAAPARRDNVDLFVKAVADFRAVDGEVSIPALLAYLTAEADEGNGLDVATPTQADSVKLLTVHRAKGLEWAEVFCVGVCETRFPTNRSRTLWTSSPAVLPAPLRGDAADLPQLSGFDVAALEAYRTAVKAHDADEELRLGYVAYTRAAHRLHVSSYLWSRRTTAFGPSLFQQVVRDQLGEWGEEPQRWLTKPERGVPNPNDAFDASVPWPVTEFGQEQVRRRAAAEIVNEKIGILETGEFGPDPDCDLLDASVVAAWDSELQRLLNEARQDRAEVIEVPLPSSLSATSLTRLRDDAEAFARELARPMPRPPAPQARQGTEFHHWVEARFGQQTLLTPDELPGRADVELDQTGDLQALIDNFEAGPFADRSPYRVEAPFALVVDGQVIRGRIDAVYREPDGTYLVVDWKTGRSEQADVLQLGIYRLAWAELNQRPLSDVRAAFYYVRSGRLVEPQSLPGRSEIAAMLSAPAG